MRNRNTDEELVEKLQTWTYRPSPPSNFQREVWARIAMREAIRRNTIWQSDLVTLSGIIARHQYTLAVFGLSIAGLVLARIQVMSSNARRWRAVEF